jgi:hypothetical protein
MPARWRPNFSNIYCGLFRLMVTIASITIGIVQNPYSRAEAVLFKVTPIPSMNFLFQYPMRVLFAVSRLIFVVSP